MNKVISYLFVLTMFVDSFILFEGYFEFYGFYLFFIAFLSIYYIQFKKLEVHSGVFLIIILLTIIGIYKYYLQGYGYGLLFKQIIALILFSVCSYLFLRINEFDTPRIFKYYFRVAFLVALVGIAQEVFYLLEFSPGYDYSFLLNKWKLERAEFGLIRINSIVSEPSHLALALTPAFFVSLHQVIYRGKEFSSLFQNLVIITAYILTFSGVAFIGVFISAFLIINKYNFLLSLFRLKYLFVVIPLTATMVIFGYYGYRVPEIRDRVDDGLKMITGEQIKSNVNLSVYVLYSHFMLAKQSFLQNPILGSGIGSHALTYDKYIDKLFDDRFALYKSYGFNRADANSLFVRLLSETGLLGLCLMAFFLFHYKVSLSSPKHTYEKGLFWMMNNSILVYFLLRLLRTGHYFSIGFFIFLYLYYYSYKSRNHTEEDSTVILQTQ